MKTEIKYKVITDCNDSAIMEGAANILYSKDKYVTSSKWLNDQGYYPFVFADKKTALDFIGNGNLHVFKALVKGHHKKKKLPQRYHFSKLSLGLIEKSQTIFPKGTEMWEYVKLVKEVKNEFN